MIREQTIQDGDIVTTNGKNLRVTSLAIVTTHDGQFLTFKGVAVSDKEAAKARAEKAFLFKLGWLCARAVNAL